jgi:hypothetical protein
MVGDIDDSANPLWSLHAKEAKSHDEARIQCLKNNMDGVLIFVRVYISPSYCIASPEIMHGCNRLGGAILCWSHFLYH